jgi:hypothetical protein
MTPTDVSGHNPLRTATRVTNVGNSIRGHVVYDFSVFEVETRLRVQIEDVCATIVKLIVRFIGGKKNLEEEGVDK